MICTSCSVVMKGNINDSVKAARTHTSRIPDRTAQACFLYNPAEVFLSICRLYTLENGQHTAKCDSCITCTTTEADLLIV